MNHRNVPILLACLLSLLTADASRAGDPSALVYYQLTASDGQVRDQFQPPQTNEKIVSVVRISRYDSPAQQGTMISTETGVTRYNAPRLVKQDMQWDGAAWVVPADPAGPGDGDNDDSMARALLAEARRITAELARMRRLRGQARSELADAEAIHQQLAGKDAQQAAARQLQRARKRAEELDARMQKLQGALEVLLAEKGPLSSPTGSVEPKGLENKDFVGAVRQTDRRRVLPHRLQVWPMDKAKGPRTIRVSMAHPEAGPGGAFCYVAYADTDADGKPDAMIGRSDLVEVKYPGQWSRWDFQTDQEAVFVGNAWAGPHRPTYCRKLTAADIGTAWTGLGQEVWVSGYLGADPDEKFWPYLSNIRVRLLDAPIRRADHRLRDR